MGKGRGGGRSRNDQRSDSMNPNNAAHQASIDNRANQLNPEHSAYHSSRGRNGDDDDDNYDNGVKVVQKSSHNFDCFPWPGEKPWRSNRKKVGK